MSVITLTAWQVDPAYSLVGENGMARPDQWTHHPVEGGSPYGTTAHVSTGDPVSIDPYLREVRLEDNDGDGFISRGELDTFSIGDATYQVWEVYRGDVMVVNGQTMQVVTLYGYKADGGAGTAVSLPLDANGKLIAAFSGILSATHWSMDAEAYPIPMDALPCFLAHSRVATPAGWVAAKDLRPGDLVFNCEARAEPLIWVTSTVIDPTQARAPAAVLPIRIPAGALGACADLWLSPLHRVLCLDHKGREVLIPARHLLGRQGIGGKRPPAGPIHYVHLVLRHHGLLLVEGVVCESFYAGPQGLARLHADERAHLRRCMPELAQGRARPVRPLLDRMPMVARRLDPALPLPLTGQTLRRKALAEVWV